MTTATTIPVRLQLRQDTAANWTSVNPTLLAGELGRESNTGKIKIGNGSSTWTALAYLPGSELSAYPIVNADIAAGAAIALSKLATGALPTAITVASANIVDGTIVDADVNAAADIAGTKIVQGSTSVRGTVQLEDSFTSTSTTTAATPAAVKAAYDLAAAGSGTVTSVDVTGGTGLTSSGGPITTSGAITVNLDNTAVAPGSYTYASITVDQQGRLTAASSGTAAVTAVTGTSPIASTGGTTPAISIQDGTTTQKGAVQLEDSTSSTSTTTAATPASVKAAYDLADAALPKAGGVLTGDVTLNAQSDLRFADADSSNYVGFQAPATVSSDVLWTLPAADGSIGQVLSTNGTGTLDWTTPSVGGPIAETKQVIDFDYTLTAGFNGVSAGPVEVAATYTVTVPAGATWVIV